VLGVVGGLAQEPTPKSAESYYSHALTLFESHRSSEAIAPLRAALKLNASHAAAAHLLAASLAETGRCEEALPQLKKAAGQALDTRVRRAVEVGGLRCSLTLNRTPDALTFIQLLSRDFAADPDVLYMLVHAYSDLSLRASRDLLYKAPGSYQVHQLNAEALETQGKWDEAVAEYRQVLEKVPQLPGIHYRLGRLLLSRPDTPNGPAQAKREFEEELKINPQNAGAEFVLGEMARRDGDHEQAIGHFGRAVKYDSGFAAAQLGLGKSLLGASRQNEAIPPLEAAVKLDPQNPEGHFQLSIAYRRAGRNADASREAAMHKQLADDARQLTENIQKNVQGITETRRPE
jgi:tetratricopeptide (TPR) repeat protein